MCLSTIGHLFTLLFIYFIFFNLFYFLSCHRVPDEFVTQRVDIANPPTLILVVESLLEKIEKNKNENYCSSNIDSNNEEIVKSENSENGFCINNEKERISKEQENKLLLSFLTDLYPALDEWVKWFLSSQKGPGNPEGKDQLLSFSYFLSSALW
jgi:Glycosyl hydrolase family 63 C-terminal domain